MIDQENLMYNEKSEYLQNQSCHRCKAAVYVIKPKNKSEQNLACTRSLCTKKLCRNSEPHIAFKQKKPMAKFSRKAKSYFQKNSHSALVDSDCTLVQPNYRSI